MPSPSVSYSAPVVVGHGLYDGPYGHRGYGHGLYSSYGSSYGSSSPYYHSSGVKVITPTYKSYYGGHYGSLGYHGGLGYSSGYHGGIGYSSGYHGGISSGYHGGLSFHGGGLGLSIGGKYGFPLKFGLKYQHWK